jgi:hypothetical protein
MEVVPLTEEHFAEINIDELKILAEKYKKQQERVKAYHKQHPEKTNEKVKKYYKKIKELNNDKYQHILDSKKQYYQNVVKPKLQAKKQIVCVN